MAFAEKLNAPIVNTLLGKGACPEDHPLHLGMLGMHGTAYANKAVADCDLIMAIGARWDDRITGKLEEFCKDAAKIVDIDVAELGEIIQPDVSLAGDARLVIEDLIPTGVTLCDSDDWIAQCDAWRVQFPLKYAKKGGLRAQYVLDRLDKLGGRDCIISTDVGQHQMWCAQFSHYQESHLAELGWRWHHGLWRPKRSARRHWQRARSPGRGWRWRLQNDHARTGDAACQKGPSEGADRAQSLPWHDSPMAGAVL